jgi:hypothetical protein
MLRPRPRLAPVTRAIFVLLVGIVRLLFEVRSLWIRGK